MMINFITFSYLSSVTSINLSNLSLLGKLLQVRSVVVHVLIRRRTHWEEKWKHQWKM